MESTYNNNNNNRGGSVQNPFFYYPNNGPSQVGYYNAVPSVNNGQFVQNVNYAYPYNPYHQGSLVQPTYYQQAPSSLMVYPHPPNYPVPQQVPSTIYQSTPSINTQNSNYGAYLHYQANQNSQQLAFKEEPWPETYELAVSKNTAPEVSSPFEQRKEVSTESDVDRKRCKRCDRFYTNAELNNCKHHPGTYRNVYQSKFAVGRVSSWSCCSAPNRDSSGCKVGTHVECMTTTETLKKYTNYMEKSVPKQSTPSKQIETDTLIDLTFDDIQPKQISQSLKDVTSATIQSKVKLENGDKLSRDSQFLLEPFIKHYVKLTDTVVGLSLKYQVPVDEIKKLNKLRTDEELWTRGFVKIPANENTVQEELTEDEKAKIQADLRKRMLLRFKRITQCKTDNEALYYLSSNEFKFDDAVKDYQDDLKWQTEHAGNFRRSQRVI